MDDTCPTYWPALLWWLIHHPHGPGPDPGPIDRELVAKLDAHFANIAVAALAGRLSDKKAGHQIGTLASKLASNPMPGVAELGGPVMAGR